VPAPPEREPFPSWIDPMLLSSGPLPPNGESWVFELKWDGMRAQLAVENGAVRLRSRARRDWTAEFPELRDMAADLGAHRHIILDGELVCLDHDGKPDFERLRSRLVGSPRSGSHPLVRLMIFDILHLDGFAVRALPYVRRRELLDALGLHARAWSTPRTFTDGVALASVVAEQRLEGVVPNASTEATSPEAARRHGSSTSAGDARPA
jgi:bifunctional non-homologous end joining protein LigD